MATIYLTGYKNSNLGDDLFFVTVLKRYPKEHFIFEDISSGYYTGLFKDFDNVDVIPSIQDSYIQRIINRIKRIAGCNIREQYYSSYRRSNTIKADVYLKIGGSVFIQPEKDVRAVKDQFLSDYFYFGGIPFFYIGCNFGPFSSPEYFKNAEYVVRNCDGICYRDSYSYNLFKHLKNVRLAPDVLFGTRNVFPYENKIKNSIGISLIDFSSRKSLASYSMSYLESISSFLRSQNNNYDLIRLFSFCEPEGDGVAIKEVLAQLPARIKSKIEVITYNKNLSLFLTKFSEMESLIATRFHAMILGFVYGIKTTPIVYSKKITHALNDLDQKVSAINLSDLNVETLIDSVSCSKIIDVDKQINSSQDQFIDFDSYLNL